ncbi:MAG: VOC family protein [Streptosporangiaceae bacterium]|nr:VOC family protein [Streptosporangiaceae bacterium]MBV9856406.1 VOC family protein [Streptosporangiaceae bacterium]
MDVPRPQVNFYVEDIEATARFYRGLLGFTETFRTPQQGTAIHVELRLDRFTLGLVTTESLRDVYGVTVGTRRHGAEVVVWTDDVDAAFADLSTAITVGIRRLASLTSPSRRSVRPSAWSRSPRRPSRSSCSARPRSLTVGPGHPARSAAAVASVLRRCGAGIRQGCSPGIPLLTTCK